jgi:ABC-type protease/lipase transport system fused ATPase/permease subunit
MQRLVVHKVGVGSLGKLIGTWFAIIGVVVGIISAVVSTVSVFANNSYSFLAGLGIAVLLVVGWVLIYPVIMFLLGWLQGAILAVVFNVVVSGSGGLSVHVEETNMDGTAIAKK